MTKEWLFGVCLLFCAISIAQQIDLKGKITNSSEVEGIHILNTSSHFNAVTNETGHFSIRAQLHDTLLISSVRYVADKLVISEEIFQNKTVVITLNTMVNELDEVVLGPNLSGNLATDLKNIKTEESINFDDVGIPGFQGKPEEKIVPVVVAFFPTNVNLEAVYKYLSGYYKKLKVQRKWEKQNMTAALMIQYYSPSFFEEAYSIPENRLYDFLLFCIETTEIQQDFLNENYANVLSAFKLKSAEYVDRLIKEEQTNKKE